jgi:hypothetical protein
MWSHRRIVRSHCRVGSIKPKDKCVEVRKVVSGDYTVERLFIHGHELANRAVRSGPFPERTSKWRWLWTAI